MMPCDGDGLAASPGDVAPLLASASLYRFLSVALRLPRPGRAAELSSLAPLVPASHRELAARVAALAGDDLEPHYHRVLGAGGACRSCETDVLPSPGAKGQVLADIAGFYRAFFYDPARDLVESPDHVAVELGFLAWVTLKEAYAAGRGAEDEASVCRDAAGKFLAEHLGRWAAALAGRIAAVGAVPFYVEAAGLLSRLRVPDSPAEA